jgi:hypothetical protein
MDGTAVQKIADLESASQVVEINGRKYSRSAFRPVIEYDPRPSAVEGMTLTGLVDYIASNRESIHLDSCFLRVVSPTRVDLVEAFSGDCASRTIFYSAKLDSQLPEFRFNEFLSVEDFIIKARALFAYSEDLDAIIDIASRVVAQNEITANDDGLSQEVRLRKGVSGALSEGATTKGMYQLRPYRTFREVTQPSSMFILRLKANEGELPRVALFDAEGGAWRNLAMIAVKDYLGLFVKDIPILA